MTAVAAFLVVTEDCPDCGSELAIRRRRSDGAPFIGCTNYPRCTFTSPTSSVEQKLANEVVSLKGQLAEARRSPPSQASQFDRSAMRLPVGADDIKSLLVWAHPDRHASGVDAHELGVRLTALLTRAKQNGTR